MYKHLQNGSDIRGVAIKTPNSEVTLTKEVVKSIGAALVKHLANKLYKTDLRIAVGHDSRLSAHDMFVSLASGIEFMGAKAVYTGLSSTPAMFFSTILEAHNYDAGVIITASHLPYERNGFKFFTKSGGFEKDDISTILKYAEEFDGASINTKPIDDFEHIDIMHDYADTLRNIIIKKASLGDKPLNGLHIIIDAGNGAGGYFEKLVLQPLGAKTEGSVFTEPDGRFPNHAPNPEDSKAMHFFSEAVVKSGADLGIIFDTDVDRAAVVLNNGLEINRNRLIALMTAILTQTEKDAVIVTDSITSTGLTKFINNLGATHIRFKRGYKNVINEAIKRTNAGENACLAIETSGHGAIRENYYLDDGAYMACLIVAELAKRKKQGKTLESLIEDLEEPAEAKEIRIKIKGADFKAYGQRVLDTLSENVEAWAGYSKEKENYEGVRVNADKANGDGWFLLRLSLHDPVMPLNIESNSVGGVEKIEKRIIDFLKGFEGLEL